MAQLRAGPVGATTGDVDLVRRLATKYGVSREEAESMNERVTRLAADEGLALRLDIARPGNTFDAHRLLHLAAARGVQDEVKEAFLAAYQTQGERIADPEVLARVAVATGLDATEVAAVLDGDAYAGAVRADEREAQELGVRAVPLFVLDRRYALSGAQPSDVLLAALHQAWDERSQVHILAGSGEGTDRADACGPDGCELPAR